MMTFPLSDGKVLAVIEPGNILRLKDGRPLMVAGSMVVFTPDMEAFAKLLGVDGFLPERQHGPREQVVQLTPEQITGALKACQSFPEVVR